MNKFKEGEVVIVKTGQAGSIVGIGKDICVLLLNRDLWYGFEGGIRLPQSKEELDACPVEVDRFKGR